VPIRGKNGYQNTFSDWAGPVNEAGGNLGAFSGSFGWSNTYTTYSLGVGPGLSVPKAGTGSYMMGTTYLIGSPYYSNPDDDPDPDLGHIIH
jgi:hypothetical protein